MILLFRPFQRPASRPHVLFLGLLVTALALCSGPLHAQTSNAALLQGRVRASDGSSIPGAHLELLHGPTGAIRRTEAGADGQFLFVGVRIGGPYTLTATHVGFSPQKQSGIYLGPFAKSRIDVVMTQTNVQGSEFVITGARSASAGKDAAGIELRVDRRQLDMLPHASASLEDAQRLSPYMAGGNAIGFNRVYNDVALDGVTIADAFGLQHAETLPTGMAASPLTMESIEDVRVELSPFDVQRSGFTGAAISATSRGGSSVLSGSAYGSAAGGWLLGRDPDDGRRDLRGFMDQRAGLRLGGPSPMRGGFFFVTAEASRMRLPIERAFGAATTGGNIYSFQPTAVSRFTTFLDTAYAYAPGRMDRIQLERASANVFARYDMSLAPGHRLSVRYNLLMSRTDRPPYETSVYAEGTLARNTTTAQAFLVSLNSLLGKTATNELLIGFTRRRFRSADQGRPFPYVDVIENDRLRWWHHLVAGTERGAGGEQVDEDHVEVRNSTTIAAPEHLITFGLQGDLHVFRTTMMSDVWGRYSFRSYNDLRRGIPSEYEYRYPRIPGALIAPRWRALQAGVFVQDEWNFSPTVVVSAGVRADLPMFPDRPAENPVVHEAFASFGYDLSTSRVPASRLMISPRLGITIDPKDDHSVRVRGGVGVFTGRIPYAWIGNLYDHTGLDYVHIKEAARAPAFVADPYHQPVPGPGNQLKETMEIVTIAPDFVLPQEVRWTLGVDLSLAWNVRVTLESIFSRTLQGVVFRNVNLEPTGHLASVGTTVATEGSRDEREIYGYVGTNGAWTYARNDDRFTNVMVMSNETQGSSTFHTLQVQRVPDGTGLFASIAYSNGSTEDINSGLWDNAYDQWRYNPAELPNQPRLNYSSLDRAHRIAVGGGYQWEWAPGYTTTVGMMYTGTSGTPYSYVYDGDLNGDGEAFNDLFYVPAKYTDLYLVDLTLDGPPQIRPPTDPQYNEFFKVIAEDDYLKMHRGTIVERNGARTPWIHQVDLRAAQTVPLGGGHNLEFSGELLNVLNLIDGSWGKVRIVPNQIVPILKLYQLDWAGRPWFEWAPRTSPTVPEPLLSRWRLRFGVRYSF